MSAMRTLCLLSLLFADVSGLRTSSHTSSSKTSNDAKPVFYLIVMGKLSYRHQVSLWLSSLRKLGGATNEVVLVTDKPQCLAKTLEEAKLLGQKISSSDAVDIYGPGEGYEGNVHMIKRPSVKHIYHMKMEKTRAWTNVKAAEIPHPVSSIIYTDEDIVIGKDLTAFVQLIRDTEKAEKRTLALFRDTGASKGELHTGVVVMFPGEDTDACLQTWAKKLGRNGRIQVRKGMKHALKEDFDEATLKDDMFTEFDEKAMGPDQRALGASSGCKSKEEQRGIKILPAEFFWFPTSHGLKEDMKAEFIHFTNTGRWKAISHDLIKEYLLKLGIPEHIDPMGSVKDVTCASDGTLAANDDTPTEELSLAANDATPTEDGPEMNLDPATIKQMKEDEQEQ